MRKQPSPTPGTRSVPRASALRIAALALLLLPTLAAAKPAEKKVAALIIMVEGESRVPKDIAEGIRGFFKQAASFYKEIEVRTGDALKKKVRHRIVKCKQDVECLAQVGKRNSLHEVILARVEKPADDAAESDEAESDEAESDEAESDEAESDEAESDEAESDKVEGDKVESDKAESDKAESDKAESDKAESDKAKGEKAKGKKAKAKKAKAEKAKAEKAKAKKAKAKKAKAEKAKAKKAKDAKAKKAKSKRAATKRVLVTFQAIDCETGKIVREQGVEIASAGEVQAQMARHFFGIAGITTPGYLEIEDAPASITVDARPADTTIGPIRLLPGPHSVTVAGETRETMILPGEMRKMSLEDFGLSKPEPPVALATAPTGTDPAAETANSGSGTTQGESSATSAAADTTTVTETTPAAGSSTADMLLSRPLTLAGIGAGLVGGALLGVGAVAAGGTSVSISAQTSQTEAARRNEDARDAASRANLMLGIGSGLLAAGVGLVIVDTFVLTHADSADADTISVGADPSTDGVRLWLGGRF